ncbi:hypothetical protein UF75_5299 [Desulfosporosinus sp. I2]|uniref:hypothetical protein n=1 Tax=Desulfosporosinus sp. I2 TaxID=1617025 RepID=UPI0005EF594C|nr:hypothetical protein [Desulfosporosinus sp. I2]KJR44323.1 hypothetical protein UF75_5299 [Desulfosporosinus sp. I2]
MSEIVYGLYEQIINGIINENLNKVDHQLVIKNTQPLDSAESSKILADYLTKILREVFDYIEDGVAVVRVRVNLCNGILQYIAECIQKGSFSFKKDKETLKRVESFLISQDAQMLLSLVDKKASRPKALAASEKPVRPDFYLRELPLAIRKLYCSIIIVRIVSERKRNTWSNRAIMCLWYGTANPAARGNSFLLLAPWERL